MSFDYVIMSGQRKNSGRTAIATATIFLSFGLYDPYMGVPTKTDADLDKIYK